MKQNIFFVSLTFIIIFVSFAYGQSSDEAIAKVISIKGNPQARSQDQSLRELKFGAKLFKDDVIITDESSRIQVRYANLDLKSIAENTEYRIKAPVKKDSDVDNSKPTLIKGAIRVLSGALTKKNQRVNKEETTVAATAISGTTWRQAIINTVGYISVMSGDVQFWNEGGTAHLGPNAYFHIADVKAWTENPDYLLSEPLEFDARFLIPLAGQISRLLTKLESLQGLIPIEDIGDFLEDLEDDWLDSSYNASYDDYFDPCNCQFFLLLRMAKKPIKSAVSRNRSA